MAVSVAYLGVALWRGGRGRAWRAAGLAVLTGLTVAQPVGVKAVPLAAGAFEREAPRPAAATAVHRVGPFRFEPYRQRITYLNGESGYPPDWLKLRSSFLIPGLLTNGTKVERLCGTTGRPCWSARGRQDALRLVRAADGEWRYRILTADGKLPSRQLGAQDPPYGFASDFRLRVGLVSVAGLVYWLLLGGLVTASAARARTDPRPTP